MSVDVSLCAITVWFALYLRLEEWVSLSGAYLYPLVGSVVLALPIFIRNGLYRAIFRFTGWNAMLGITRAMALYGLLFFTVFTVVSFKGVPRSIGIIQPLLLFLAIGVSRALVRYWLGDLYACVLKRQHLPGVLIYGTGAAGRQLATVVSQSEEQRLVGFLDDDVRLHGNILNGRTIYAPEKLSELIPRLGVTDVLLTKDEISRERRKEILTLARPFGAHVRTLPRLSTLAAGQITLSDVRKLEVEDLLGRDPVEPDPELINRDVRGKVVMVTGAGGSIGSELCRQILACGPAKLLLVELNEYALYQIHQDLCAMASAEGARTGGQATELVPLLANVQHESRINEIMAAWGPHTVYHAAAYKHVPLVEHNPIEGILNNVWGTWVCARTAQKNNVGKFVLISTDKAVRPTNIMGATKRLAEMVLQAMSAQVNGSGGTCLSMVRFGNVLGSSGSVVPLFREQIRKGGPITLTHPEITRYFMTIQEASQLVIQAGSMAEGGDVFVLDMGQPVKIIDLARCMVEISGLAIKDGNNGNGDIEIEISGLRPGEKLYEELLIGNNPKSTQHERILKAHEDFLDLPQLEAELAVLQGLLAENDVPAVRSQLAKLVAEYSPADDIVDWVHCCRNGQQAQGE